VTNDSPARNSPRGRRQRSDSNSTPLRRQRSQSRETLCRVKAHTPANLFQEEPDMFESIKLNPQKTLKQKTVPKV